MGVQECDVLRRVLENSQIDLEDYGVNVNLLREGNAQFTFEEIQASLEDKQGLKINLKEQIKSRKLSIMA